jgi:hypothetical protein
MGRGKKKKPAQQPPARREPPQQQPLPEATMPEPQPPPPAAAPAPAPLERRDDERRPRRSPREQRGPKHPDRYRLGMTPDDAERASPAFRRRPVKLVKK